MFRDFCCLVSDVSGSLNHSNFRLTKRNWRNLLGRNTHVTSNIPAKIPQRGVFAIDLYILVKLSIVTSHDLGTQKVVFWKGILLISKKSRLVKYHNLMNFASNHIELITSWFPTITIKSIKSTNQPATTR